MLGDEDLREMRIFLLSGNTFSGSRSMEFLDEIARLRALVDAAESNARLHFEAAEEMRAENEKLRAARLKSETVREIRAVLYTNDWDRLLDAFNRCYPPEEV